MSWLRRKPSRGRPVSIHQREHQAGQVGVDVVQQAMRREVHDAILLEAASSSLLRVASKSSATRAPESLASAPIATASRLV